MIKEFAVDPEAIARDWETFRYCIEKFGFSKGRTIARFPAKWEREVFKHAEKFDLKPVQRKRLEEKLLHAKRHALVKSRRQFEADQSSWVSSALNAHGEKPFHAIIVDCEGCSSDGVTGVDDLDEHVPPLLVQTSCVVRRTAEEMAAAFTPLLVNSDRALIVDPYFDPANEKYIRFLEAIFLTLERFGKNEYHLEVHCLDHDRRSPFSMQSKAAVAKIQPRIPQGVDFSISYWRQRENGEDFHDRFLITPRGGASIGAGFSVEGENETANVLLLDERHASQILERFGPGADVYDRCQNQIRLSSLET